MAVIKTTLLFIFVFLVSFSATASTEDSFGKKIIYCPEQVECQNDTCSGVGEDKEYFKYSYSPSEPFYEGTYYFRGVGDNVQNNPYGYGDFAFTRCSYISRDPNRGPFQSYVSLFAKNGSNFGPIMENWTKWEAGSHKDSHCIADASNACPLIESKELLIDPKIRQKTNSEEYTNGHSLNIDLVTENGVSMDRVTGDKILRLDYETLLNACGAKKQCKIYMQVRPFSRYKPPPQSYVGSILISTEGIMRIISIAPLNGNPNFVMKVNPPMNNTIIFQSK
jgi:hypothetical protein